MKEQVAFSMGTGVVVLGVALVASGVVDLFGLISIVLYGVGIICYLRGNRFRSLSPSSRKIFWILLFFGLLITASSYLLDPGQWQITHRHLSAALRKSFVPIGVICGIVWMLLTARTRRTPSRDA